MDKLLKKLISTFSISGFEDEMATVIISTLKEMGVECNKDIMGNVVVKMGTGKEKLMISSSMGRIGLIATDIMNDGTIKTTALGDFNSAEFANSTVKFKNGTKGKLVSSKKDEMLVDIGYETNSEAEKKVREGMPALFCSEPMEVKEKIMAGVQSNILGCYTLLQLIKEIHSADINTMQVYFVFSVQNQLRGRGARAAAFAIGPDYAIILQGSDEIDLVSGPALSVMERGLIMHHELKERLEGAALRADVKIQSIVSKDASDGAAIHKEGNGVKTGTILFPVKYINTPSEAMYINDLNQVSKLLKSLIS